LEQHSVNSEGDILEPLEANPDRIGEEDCEDPKTELLDALKVGWKLLTDRERHIVVQCSKGKTCEEIAVTLHISKQAVAQSLQNGRKKIFSILEESND
jgi:DNA-binding NarL/FixJ family response regulator